MRGGGLLGASLTLAAWFSSSCVFAQGRTVAITVDDLPYAPATANVSEGAAAAETVNGQLLKAFSRHRAPVIGFVIQKRVEAIGFASGIRILEAWVNHGFDLGNHTYSHLYSNDLSPEEIERDIVRGESTLKSLMNKAGKKPEFFRFPMNHTGDTKAKHDRIAAFLSKRGYRLAACTIDNSDYLFNDAYVRMLARNDNGAARKLRIEYLAYTSAEIDCYAALNKQVLGYEPPQVMLLHVNRLNAEVIEQVLTLFEEKWYRFVSLDAAQSDAAYRTPDAYITKYGPMWGYRWAKERNVKVNGSLEPDPPKWILEYGKAGRN
jgi:peptidoglycan/xylan/chitin deacetylase (PgdA/CDA1 family)